MNVYRQAPHEEKIRVRFPSGDAGQRGVVASVEWLEMYQFWLACHDKRDTLTNCLKFMALMPA